MLFVNMVTVRIPKKFTTTTTELEINLV